MIASSIHVGITRGRAIKAASVMMILMAGLLVMTGQPRAQSAENLQVLTQELERMKRDLSDLQRQVYQGGVKGGNNVVRPSGVGTGQGRPLDSEAAGLMQIKLTQIEADIRSLNGRMEEFQFQIQTLAEQLTRLKQDYDYRLSAIEGKLGLGALPVAPEAALNGAVPEGGTTNLVPQASGDGVLGQIKTDEAGTIVAAPIEASPAAPNPAASGAAEAQDLSPKQLYDQAFGFLQARQYDQAEASFSQFITRYPQDELAGNANYWLGETYYVRGNHNAAANQFIKTYTDYEKSAKAPHALLKLALSLVELDKVPTACDALATLQDEYPNTDQSTLISAKSYQQKYCD